MLAGRRPERLGLRDWLDAGYVIVVEGTDPEARALLDDLFASETDEQLVDRGQALRAETEARLADRDEELRRRDAERRKKGRATTYRRAPEGAAQAAADEWDQIRSEASQGAGE